MVTAATNGLALLGARTSADTVIAMFGSRVYIYMYIYINTTSLSLSLSIYIYIHIGWYLKGKVAGHITNHQRLDCVLNPLFRRRSKKASKLRVTGLCVGNSRGTGEFPHKGPVTRIISPFDDAIMSPR